MIYFLATIIFLLPTYLIKFNIFGIPTTMLEILIYISAILTLVFSSKYLVSSIKQKTKSFLLPITLFIIAGIISTVISPDKMQALGILKAYIIDPIIFFFVLIINIKNNNRHNKNINLLINALIASGVVVSIYAIYQKITGNLPLDGRVLSVYGFWPNASANYLALYLSPIILLIIGYQLINKVKGTISYLYDLSFFICFFALYFTQSRAGAAATVLGIFLFLIYKYWDFIKKKLWLKIVIITIIILGLFVSYQLFKPDYSLSQNEGGRITTSNNIHWEIYKTTGEILQSNWFLGVGLGNYQNHFNELTKDRVNFPEYITPYALTPHNLFLTIWVNLGFLGLISFIWILVEFFKICYKNRLNSTNIILAIVIISIIAYGIFDTSFWKNDLAVLFWLLIALSINNRNIQTYEKQSN